MSITVSSFSGVAQSSVYTSACEQFKSCRTCFLEVLLLLMLIRTLIIGEKMGTKKEECESFLALISGIADEFVTELWTKKVLEKGT